MGRDEVEGLAPVDSKSTASTDSATAALQRTFQPRDPSPKEYHAAGVFYARRFPGRSIPVARSRVVLISDSFPDGFVCQCSIKCLVFAAIQTDSSAADHPARWLHPSGHLYSSIFFIISTACC